MRVVLTTNGTTGSIEPLLGLAQCLEARGHSVVVAAPEPLAARGRQLVETITLESTESAFKVGTTPDVVDPVVENLRQQVPMVPDYFRQLRALCEDSDVLVAFPFQLAAPLVRDALGIPYVSAHFSPYSGFASIDTIRRSAEIINPIRREFGLDPVEDPLGADAASKTLALFPVSPSVFRRPKRWPDHHRVVGYWFSRDDTPPTPELAEFVNDGPPPIVISLGSVKHVDPQRVTRVFIDAAVTLDTRVVLQRGWSGLGDVHVPDNVFVADFVPHAWLFPRASVIVHAGGAGTTAAALRAGVPAVIVPHVLDQPLWAALVKSRKCGVSIPFDQLGEDTLVEAVRHVSETTTIGESARDMAARIANEDGIDTAARLIEELIGEEAKGR